MKNAFNAAKRGEALERHSRKCTICHHPEREDIEDEFLHWHFPNAIAVSYDLGDERVVYRHARATGLMARRRDNCQAALDRIVEHADALTSVKADSVIRAIRAYSCLSEAGRWIKPPARPAQVVLSIVQPAAHTLAASKVPIEALPARAREIARSQPGKRLHRAGRSPKASAANRKSGSKPEILIGGKQRFSHTVAAKAESRVCGLPRHTSDAKFAALRVAKPPQTGAAPQRRARMRLGR